MSDCEETAKTTTSHPPDFYNKATWFLASRLLSSGLLLTLLDVPARLLVKVIVCGEQSDYMNHQEDNKPGEELSLVPVLPRMCS